MNAYINDLTTKTCATVLVDRYLLEILASVSYFAPGFYFSSHHTAHCYRNIEAPGSNKLKFIMGCKSIGSVKSPSNKAAL